MGLLQIQLVGGNNKVILRESIARSPIKLQSVQCHFNTEKHGFFMARIRFPFLTTTNVRNNLPDNTCLIIPLDSTKSYTSADNLDWDLGSFNIPSSFQATVDLDNGVQMVAISDTNAGGKYNFQTSQQFAGSFQVNNQNYINGGTASLVLAHNSGDVDKGVSYPNAMCSVGLYADKVNDGSLQLKNPGTGTQLLGPIPFMYSMIMTFVYDGNSVESRVQSLY